MKPNKQIKQSKKEIQEVMQINLAFIAESMIDQIMRKARKSTKSNILKSIKDIKPKGINAYKSDLKAALAVVSSDSLDQARLEVPKAKHIKLMENEASLLFGEFETLPTDLRNKINASNVLLINTQIADLEKAIYFQFTSSANADKPIKEIESDINDKAEKYITGNAIQAGSSVVAANTVNEARNAFFFDKDVLNEIAAFEFMNDVPVAQICKDLVGSIFPVDDPNAFAYTGPLHFNCDSWIRPILKLKKDQVPTRMIPSKEGVKSIQFTENMVCNCC